MGTKKELSSYLEKIEYEDEEFPVKIEFVERKKEDALKSELMVHLDDTELLMINNGEVNVLSGDKVTTVKAGQGIMIPGRLLHRVMTSSKDDTAYYSLTFKPEFVMPMAEGSTFFNKYYKDRADINHPRVVVFDESNLKDESVIDRINTIIAANLVKKPGYELLTRGNLCLLWLSIMENAGQTEFQFNGKNIPNQDELRFISASQYIRENYQDMVTLDDIAWHVHVTKNECCRCFKRVVDIAPIDYLTRVRIFEAAKILYKEPQKVDSMQELSFHVGFNTVSYFNKMFKKHLGYTPKEFVKTMKDNPEAAIFRYDTLQGQITYR